MAGPPSTPSPPKGAQAIERALGILLTFSPDKPARTLKEICADTSITMSTAHRMIKSLQYSGFLHHDPSTGLYTLGPAVARLAQVLFRGSRQAELPAVSMPHLVALRDLTGETVGLHVGTPGGRVCIAEVESRHMMRISSGVGCTFPWHAGASSKVLLAGMSAGEVDRIIEGMDWSQIDLTPEQLRSSIERTRTEGFGTSVGETIPGASAIAVPVRDLDGRVAVAINVTGPTTRWTEDVMAKFVPDLKTAAKAIEGRLGLQS
jgi:IclR family transcriptional regulator, acetate operon repressor